MEAVRRYLIIAGLWLLAAMAALLVLCPLAFLIRIIPQPLSDDLGGFVFGMALTTVFTLPFNLIFHILLDGFTGRSLTVPMILGYLLCLFMAMNVYALATEDDFMEWATHIDPFLFFMAVGLFSQAWLVKKLSHSLEHGRLNF